MAAEQAIELDRLNHEPHLIKGMVLVTVGRADDAMIALTRARELNHNDTRTLACPWR